MFLSAARWFLKLVLVGMFPLSSVWAGGGPETTLVVVNAASPLSLTIANAYVRMRDIPDSHVVWLDDVPAADSIDIKEFRVRIWQPIRNYIAAHHLEEEIDTIAYSADFPYRVDFKSELRPNGIPENRHLGYYASLTGLTFFGRGVAREKVDYLGENRYFRRDLAPRIIPPRAPTAEEDKLVNEAIMDLKHEKFDKAVESLRSVVKTYPWSSLAWYQLARGLASSGRGDEAIKALSKAVDLGWPNSLTTRNDKLLKPLHQYPDFDKLIRQMQLKSGPFQAAHGFRNQYVWTGSELPVIQTAVTDSLNRYYLSTLLAYTGLRGNTMSEVMDYLRAAVASDGTNPDGTVYLMENSDVRTRTREPSFHATVAALTKRGRRVEMLAKGRDGQDGVVPKNKEDVIGAVVGIRRFDWGRSKSRLLPGAIAESLTSYGGDFDNGAQTKLTAFLRYGAAGSSGAVAEPYSFQAKFPVPYMHVHYADGSSLAEAFYQSVEAPYQLIVVGDPLARPFARFAGVSLASPETTQAWHDTELLKPAVKPATNRAIHHVELWVDGQYTDKVAPWDAFLWDTKTVEDGCHDVRLVAVEDTPIETRSYMRLAVKVNNENHSIDVSRVAEPVVLGDDIVITGVAPQAERVEVFQGTRLLGSAQVEDGRWRAVIASRSLGLGRVSLYARGIYHDGATVRSCARLVDVEPPPRLAATETVDGKYEEGLQVVMQDVTGGDHRLVVNKLTGRFPELRKIENTVASMHIEGEFNVAKPGFYQLALATQGRLRVKIDGRLKTDTDISGEDEGVFIPLNLDGGWHRLDLDLVPTGRPSLAARLAGDQVAAMLEKKRVRHSVQP